MLNLKNKNLVVLNTPSNFDLSVFDNIKKTEKYNKLIFLSHQINKFTYSDGVFRINKKAYYQCLGLSSFQLNNLLGLLIDAGLIEHTYTGNSFTGRLSEYKFLNAFNPETGQKHQYDATEPKCPEFIKKLIADNWRVLPTEKSAYTKEPKKLKTKKDSTVEAMQLVIDEQLVTIHSLQAELEALRASIPSSNTTDDAVILMPTAGDEVVAHVPREHEYSFASDTYYINDWAYLISNTKFTVKELEEEIYDIDENTECLIEGVRLIKKYDIKSLKYEVQIFAN